VPPASMPNAGNAVSCIIWNAIELDLDHKMHRRLPLAAPRRRTNGAICDNLSSLAH
jgi:hypothetical protein